MVKITLKDIEKAIIEKLKDINVKVYSSEVLEGFQTPCFFINIEKFENTLENSNFVKKYLDIYIRYIDEKLSNIRKIEVIEILDKLFLRTVRVNDREFIINNKIFLKNKTDYLELNFGIEYYEFLDKQEELNSEKMNDFELNL